ncbi:hypothetical protein OROGR_014379 [Orobanche gracilis]
MNSNTSMTQSEEDYLASSKFESCDDLLKIVREFYYSKGYVLSNRASRKDKHVILQCDRGGSYRERISNEPKKNTGSRLINCPFQIAGQKRSDGAWYIKVKELTHNHEPSMDLSGHPSFRRLPAENINSVKEMTKAGIPPRQILSSLRQQNQNLPVISRTIYNLKRKFRRDNLGNRSMINALFEELVKGGFTYDISHSPEGRISRLFIAHPLSIKLAKVFSNIFVMDCTYKTNKYNMPLLDIIGVSCFNTSFYSGFVELALMNGIKNKYFERAEEFDIFMLGWNNVVYSTTEALFEENWRDFEVLYKEKKDAFEYIKNIWFPWKEKFVTAWTDKYLHFGNRSSSRAEGAHAKLKLYLQVFTGDFHEVKEKISLAVEHEFNEIRVKLSSERIQVHHNCNIPLFRELHSHVSHFALQEIYKQYGKIKDGCLTPCTGHFMATTGLPCAHKIKYWQGTTLSLDLIHPHWRIDTLSLKLQDDLHNEGTDRLDEPVIQRPKGRPKSKKKRGITSTRRDPSRFELVELSQRYNSSSSNCVLQRNNEEDEESNLIDLNVFPNFSDDYIF